MSRLAPLAGADEQLHLARALGLTPLRLRDRPRPAAPARLRIAAAEPLEILRQDALLQALLRALNVTTEEVGPPAAGDGPMLGVGTEAAGAEATLPTLGALRGNAAAKRALWPALRRLRRRLLDA